VEDEKWRFLEAQKGQRDYKNLLLQKSLAEVKAEGGRYVDTNTADSSTQQIKVTYTKAFVFKYEFYAQNEHIQRKSSPICW
jgi:hypothetical protein